MRYLNTIHKSHWMITLINAGLLFTTVSNAVPVKNTSVYNTAPQQTTEQTIPLNNTTTTAHPHEPELALTDADWKQYDQLMQGANGRWYPQLSPAAILGMQADTPDDRRRFAEMVAQETHDKIARELAFNHAVFLALKRLYPNEPLILPFDQRPFNPKKRDPS